MSEPWLVRKVTGAVGLAAAVLFVAGNALWALDQPEAGAPACTFAPDTTAPSR